jgi:capsular exopolysaccharide synthesis family protein
MTPVRSENSPVEAEIAASALSPGEHSAEQQLSEAWLTVRKHKGLILAFALFGAAYGVYKGSTQPHLFDSSSTIELHSGSANEYKIGSSIAGAENTTSRITTQLAILKSDSLMLVVARSLDLANDPEFMTDGKSSAPLHNNIDDPHIRQSVIGTLQGQVNVSAIAKTDLLRIACTSTSPRLAAQIPNQLVHEYIQRSLQSRVDASKRVTDFYAGQLADLKQQVESSQAKLIDQQKRLGALGFDPSLNQYTSNLTDLNRAVNAAELARINAETRYRSVVGSGGDVPDLSPDSTKGGSSGAGAVSGLRNQLEAAQANLAQLTANGGLGPNHPRVLALKDQIAVLQQQIADEQRRSIADARAGYLAAQTGEARIRGALEAGKSETFKLRDDLVEYTLRQREFEANRTLYEGLQARLRTAAVQAGLESTEIDIVDAAVPALEPSLRPRSTFVYINTLVMLVLGVIAAFILEALDTSLRNVAQLEAVTALPTLALIPRIRTAQGSDTNGSAIQNIDVLLNPRSQFAESFRSLRTSLLLSTAGHEPRTILLTSSAPAEGKTTVSINLACILAQRNVRVLLIDADLRRPSVHHRLGLQGRVGLTSVLTGSVTLEDAIQTLPDAPMLDILASGPIPPFPTEMLSSDTMHQLLERCRGIYTHIVLDSPPLLSVTDSVVLAREADAVVIVVRYGKSSKHAVARARDLLLRSGTGISGTVLNAIDLNSPEYQAYYGEYGYDPKGSSHKDWRSKQTAFLEDQETGPRNPATGPKGEKQ